MNMRMMSFCQFFKEFWGALLGMIRGQDYYKGQVGDCSKV